MRSQYMANSCRGVALLLVACALLGSGRVSSEDQPLREAVSHDDFVIREEMVPMRDGAKLYTLIITPREKKTALPVVLRRTPYDATGVLRGHASSRLDVKIGYEFLGNDYTYVIQDIRGRFKSEGDYLMYRAPRGPFNNTETDETTDAWDTIEWLVKNVPSNGRVGIWGTSHPGRLVLAAMRDPHPALAAAVPFSPVVDAWKADDWFHWGGFRATYAFDFIFALPRKGQKVLPMCPELRVTPLSGRADWGGCAFRSASAGLLGQCVRFRSVVAKRTLSAAANAWTTPNCETRIT